MMKKILASIITVLVQFSTFNLANAQEKIILLNEGNWQSDNGKITYFENGSIVSNQWFRDKNGMKLGDTPNDIIQVNDTLIAIAVNWSNIVQFIRPDGTAVAATEAVPNCRKLASDGKYVYVTSYGHECGTPGSFFKEFTKGYVAKIDLATFQLVDAVEVGYEPEGIACYAGYLFVANTGGYAFQEDHEYEQSVSVINAATMELEKTIDTGVINLFGKMSQSGRYLLINSPGDYYDVIACSLVFDCEKALSGDDNCFAKLDYPATYSTVTRDGKFFAIGSQYSYYTSEYVFTQQTIDPEKALESDGSEGITEGLPGTMSSYISQMQSPYGLYVNPYTGYMYATDAAGYAEGGTLYQWDPEGNYLGKWKVYINPAHFLALNPNMTGITELSAPKSAKKSHLYDHSGCQVTNPQHGTIYIHNGRKIISK